MVKSHEDFGRELVAVGAFPGDPPGPSQFPAREIALENGGRLHSLSLTVMAGNLASHVLEFIDVSHLFFSPRCWSWLDSSFDDRPPRSRVDVRLGDVVGLPIIDG
jgi:hypothetical protein